MQDFDDAFRQQLTRLFQWRRDVRHFRSEPVPNEVLERLLATACLAPSVGLSQPWRFVLVERPERRQAVRQIFAQSNAQALADYCGERARLYASLKLAGLEDAPVHLAVFVDHSTTQGSGLGRRTMPQTAEYSVVMAIHTLWLAARAEGIGIGWVSILDAEQVKAALDAPGEWRLIAYLCMGYPQFHSESPELEHHGWERRRGLREFLLRR